jgi:hypothetical protein
MEEHMMQKIENVIIGIIIGAVPIIACFLAGWWISIPLVPESRIFQYALAGFLLGTLIDVIFLRNWVRHAYTMKLWVWMGIYGFYSIGMFGFFMGFPVFQVILALPAGVFVGRWLTHRSEDTARMKKAAQKTAVFTTSVLGMVCIASASIALLDPSVAFDLQGMLGLPFPATSVMILGIILSGGTLLLAIGWWLTVESVKRVYQFGCPSKSLSA